MRVYPTSRPSRNSAGGEPEPCASSPSAVGRYDPGRIEAGRDLSWHVATAARRGGRRAHRRRSSRRLRRLRQLGMTGILQPRDDFAWTAGGFVRAGGRGPRDTEGRMRHASIVGRTRRPNRPRKRQGVRRTTSGTDPPDDPEPPEVVDGRPEGLTGTRPCTCVRSSRSGVHLPRSIESDWTRCRPERNAVRHAAYWRHLSRPAGRASSSSSSTSLLNARTPGSTTTRASQSTPDPEEKDA
jgi:hypothetical protein